VSEEPNVEVNLFARLSDEPTQTEINEWTCRSKNEGICGIVNYLEKPTFLCVKCKNNYCSEHSESHLDRLAEDTIEYSSANECERRTRSLYPLTK
jgi:hypothetical protein